MQQQGSGLPNMCGTTTRMWPPHEQGDRYNLPTDQHPHMEWNELHRRYVSLLEKLTHPGVVEPCQNLPPINLTTVGSGSSGISAGNRVPSHMLGDPVPVPNEHETRCNPPDPPRQEEEVTSSAGPKKNPNYRSHKGLKKESLCDAENRREQNRLRMHALRHRESQEQKDVRLLQNKIRMQIARQRLTEEQKVSKREQNRQRMQQYRQQNPEKRRRKTTEECSASRDLQSYMVPSQFGQSSMPASGPGTFGQSWYHPDGTHNIRRNFSVAQDYCTLCLRPKLFCLL